MLRCLISCLLLAVSGCTTSRHAVAVTSCAEKMLPVLHTAAYHAQIDLGKRHFSGILYAKETDDTTSHLIFLSETGLKFFDFAWQHHQFRIDYIIPSMNKKMVVSLFRRSLYPLIAKQPVGRYVINATCTQIDSLLLSKSFYHFQYANGAAPERIRFSDRITQLAIELKRMELVTP
ncbi:MAG: hypothetical protein U0T84_02170 [Chitinophagales bacterium]